MKKILLVFTALLAISCIVAAVLWSDLRAERLANAELRSRLAVVGSIPDVPAAPAMTETPAQTTEIKPAAVATPAPVVASTPAQPPIQSDVLTRAVSAAGSAAAMAATGGIRDRDMMNDPEYRKAEVTLARIRLARANPGLAEALGISRKEADHLFEAMAEAQLKLTAELTEMVARSGTTPSLSAIMQSTTGREDPARTVLGETRYAQYQEYLRNARPALARVSTMGSSLNASGLALSDSQSRAVATAIYTEQQRQHQQAVAAPTPSSNPGAAVSMADSLAEYQKTRDANDRRILDTVMPHLTAAQIEVLQKQIEQQAAQSRRTIETARTLDARRQTPPPPASPPPAAR